MGLALALGLACAGDGPAPAATVEGDGTREGEIVAEDGARLHFRLVGTGPDTVVVPLVYWNQEAFERIARGRTFLFYDPRGRRQSSVVNDAAMFGIATDLRDLETVLRHFGSPRVALIGTSYYGALVARFALDHRQQVRQLVLVGSLYPAREPFIAYDPPDAASRRDSTAQRMYAAMQAAGRDTLDPIAFCDAYWRVEGPMTVGDPASLVNRTWPCDLPNEWPANLSAWGRGVFASLGSWDWRAELASLEVPTLVIHGERDLMVPLASSQTWARLLPRARLLLMPGAGHVPWWEHETALFEAVDTFLNGDWPSDTVPLDADTTRADGTPVFRP